MVDTFKEDEEYWNIKYMPQLEALNISVVIDPDLYNKLNKDILSFQEKVANISGEIQELQNTKNRTTEQNETIAELRLQK